MKYFSLTELCKSSTACKHGIANIPSNEERIALQALVEKVLDPLRHAWGREIFVNSGFRCAELNRLVGGAPSSQHLKGEAADISAGSKEENAKLFDLVVSLGLPFDQLIDEKNFSWIHVSYSPRHRRQILRL